MTVAATLSTGNVIAGKYKLEEILGKGATGTVWRAVHLGLERPVAIKVLHPQIAAREDAFVRFSREARVAASLDHPSSVAVLDFGEDNGVLYLVMELVAGESLRARLSRGPVSLEHAALIVRHVSAALAAAHRIRLVHRDIKPENVILPAEDLSQPPKVVDFGLAFIADPEEVQHMGRVTHDGAVTGTPAYMSPEQVRGRAIGPPSDVYSLGCMFYELLAGRPPFVGAIGEVLTRHAYAPPIPLRQLELRTSPPVALDELVLAMLSKSPSARPSAQRVYTALATYERAIDPQIGRTSSPFLERPMRAVPLPTDDDDASSREPATLLVGVVGELSSEHELAMNASGLRVRRWSDAETGDETLVWAPGASLERLAALVAAGKQVVTDVAEGDAAALPALIRVGVSDAVVRPYDVETLVRRLWRAHRLRGGPR